MAAKTQDGGAPALRGRRLPLLPPVPGVWSLALPRLAILVAGCVVAVVELPLSTRQVVVAVLAALWVTGTTVAAVTTDRGGAGSRRWLGGRVSLVDALVLGAAIATSGGAESPLRWLLIGAPALWAHARHPRVGMLGAIGAAGYLVASAKDLLGGTDGSTATAVGFLAVYAGSILVAQATLASHRREADLQHQIATERTSAEHELLARARAQQEELVQRLHDGPLQLAIAATHDVEDLADGAEVDLQELHGTLRETVEGMRTLSVALYDSVLRDAGLAAALGAVAQASERRNGPPCGVAVGPRSAGVHDALVVAVAQELLANVEKHARASRADLVVDVGGTPPGLVVAVTDDGVGMTARDRERAERDGHIGLPSIARRAEGQGGSMSVEERPRGTRVVVRLPLGGAGARS